MRDVRRSRRLRIIAAAVACTAIAGAAPAAAAASPRAVRLTIAASGDLLVHTPVWQRAHANAGGRGYDFAPMFRRIRP